MLGEPKLGRVTAGLVLTALVVAGCNDGQSGQPTTPRSTPPAAPHVGPAVFAYAGADEFRLYRDDRAIATVALGPSGDEGNVVRDAEWSADGTRLVMATSSRLYSIDATTGAVADAACTCDSLAVAGDAVYVLDAYGGTRLATYDVATLAPRDTLTPELDGTRGLLRVDGAGTRLVLFVITEDGARPVTDVVVLDPGSRRSTTVGETGNVGAPSEAEFSPRGWRGAPTFAYVANGATGASTGNDSVVWFDPSSDHPQTVTDATPLRDKTPDIARDDWNNRWENLWWAADGSLHATGTTWSCVETAPLEPPECTDRVDRTQWAFDGSTWREADGRTLGTLRDVGGSSLELAAVPAGDQDGELTLVHGTARTVLARDVRRVWTPSLTKPDGEHRPPPDAVVRYAPLVRLSKDERHLPGTADDFLSSAKLVWANESCADDTLAKEGKIDVKRLTTANGYRHHQTKPFPGVPPTCGEQPPEWDTLDPTRPYDDAPDSPPGAQGFLLDADDDLHPGTPLTDGADTAPVYYQYREREFVYYWFFYPYNDAPYKGFDHEGDWERISILLDHDTNEPAAIVYSGHGHACSRPWRDIAPGTVDGHPVVYSAIGTHASYATADSHLLRHVKVKGRQLPVWDHTSDGPMWRTWEHLADTERLPWFGYAGAWGEAGPIPDETGPVGPYPGRNLDEVHTDTPCE